MSDAVHVDRVGGFVKQHAILANAEAEQSGETAFEGFDVALGQSRRSGAGC
jgi:hypothetical protein